jgi:glycosidase
VAKGYEDVNVAVERDDPTSIFSLYRQILRLRSTSPALQLGNYQEIPCGHPDCYAYMRTNGSQRYIIMINFAGSEIQPDLSLPHSRGEILLSTRMDKQGQAELDHLMLRPYEGIIIEIADDSA